MRFAHLRFFLALSTSFWVGNWVEKAVASEATNALLVSAAASLSPAFQALAQDFEQQHPGTQIRYNFAASEILIQQIMRGAPVDVIATADQESMDKAQQQGLIRPASRANFARNQLVLVVPAVVPTSSPKIERLADLAHPNVTRIALGQPTTVPAGRYAKHVLETAQLWPTLTPKIVYAQHVRQALDYVARAEVDAGFVYLTDALSQPNRVRILHTWSHDPQITYPIAQVQQSQQASLAARFIAFVRGPQGQQRLQQFGFLMPTASAP
ncbi:molybdate ABC transporter substrate-binding protein [Parvibium lacunae]|uniref:Molybdate ABC transporter substrate-binding protein n=1 Tax=Parvibium lacunae TaxID=1888893 RepID=A0A368L438_9BURK|nr:molybdate ABC transporter substrate-binding protein [Parvibium lacunae]RCS58356.1 molybdate ABC transporter substrate-binding protein [Parvibium lacunae]